MDAILRPKNGMLYHAPLGTELPHDFDPMGDWEFVRIQENGKPLYKTPSGRLFEPAGYASDEGIDFTRDESDILFTVGDIVEPELNFMIIPDSDPLTFKWGEKTVTLKDPPYYNPEALKLAYEADPE